MREQEITSKGMPESLFRGDKNVPGSIVLWLYESENILKHIALYTINGRIV